MIEDRMLAVLKAEIGTPQPVEPMRPGLALATGVGAFSVLVSGILVAALGLRPDQQLLGEARLWGLSLAQMSLAVPLWWVALGEALPGRRRSLGLLSSAAVIAVLAHWTMAYLTHQHSPSSVPAEMTWGYGTFCFLLELSLGIPLVSWVFWQLRRGLIVEPLRVAWAGGLAAGVFGDGLWRLFCPYSDPLHILAFHTPGIGTVVLCALGVGWIWRRRRQR